jgi:hypothetical protein
VTVGLVAYVKPTTQLMAVAGVIPVALATRRLRPTLKYSAVLAAGVAIAVVPWMVRNQVAYGHLTFTTQAGHNLYIRVFDADRLPMPLDDPDGARATRIYQAGLAKVPSDSVASSAYDLIADNGRRGLTLTESTEMEGRLARKAILAHPFDYASKTWANTRGFGKLMNEFALPRAELEQKLDRADPPVGGGIDRKVWRISSWLGTLWWIASLGGLAALIAIWLRPRAERVAAAALYSSWLLVAFGTAATIPPVSRYVAQAAPLLWIVGSAGIVTIATALLSYRRTWREGRA